MSTRRRPLLAALLLAAPLALASCGKKQNTEETQPPLAPVTSTPAGDGASGGAPGRGEPRPAVERITVTGSVEGLDDMMAAFKKLGESWMPDQATDPKAEIQAGLLGAGFGPGFFNNIDLDGLHAFTSHTPVSGGGPQDASVSASVAVVDARKLIENLPQSQRPSPLGEGMWELKVDSTRMLMREQGKELLIGLSNDDIAKAGQLRGQTKPGRRVRVKATNIPTDDIDPAAVLEDLPGGSELAKQLSEIVRELEAVTFEADFGTTRELQAEVGASAPFHKLGLGPIGTPRTAATSLESRLPPDPMFVTTLSWGDPTLLHKLVDSTPLSDVPDPVKPMVEKAIKSAHGLLDQVATDVAFALYIDKKGRATFVMAASVKDEAKTKAALQGVHQVIVEGVETQASMAGKNKDAAFTAKLELDGLKVPGGKADRLAITIPKDFQGDAREARMFLGKNTLEVVSHVADGTAVLAIGAGAKALVADVARPGKQSLAQHAGLQGLRKSMGGCQICMSGDPLAYFRFRLLLVRDETTDKTVSKQASERMAQLGKLSPIGEPGVGVKVEAEKAAVGLVVPQATLFAPRAAVEKLGEINRFVDDPESAMAAKKEETRKPAAKAEAEKKPAAKASAEKKPAAKASAEKKPAAKASAAKKPAAEKAD
jgi:hypothetical protein